MKRLIKWLNKRRFAYKPLISIEIDKDRLINNLVQFQQIAPKHTIAPVLKSNAYGHGLYEVARIIQSAIKSKNIRNIPFLVVDSHFEAMTLRHMGVKIPLLVIGYTRPEIIIRSHLKNVSFTVTSMKTLQDIISYKDSMRVCMRFNLHLNMPRIHLKIDTGMNRQGILPEEMKGVTDLLRENDYINLEGICSHLADADNSDESFSEKQICEWNHLIEILKEEFPKIKYWHIGNTYGHNFTSDIDANISRLGIGMYGLLENKVDDLNVEPVLEMKTIITGIKKIKKGENVGYNMTFTAKDNMTIATIPVGYYEGLDRRLSNLGTVLVGENRIPCPIIGRISMNITTIDISHLENVNIGDLVIVISKENNDSNSIVSIASKCQTIPYDILSKIPAHLKRVVI